MFDLISALERVIERGGSDLHLKAGSRPLVRINGELDWLDPHDAELDSYDTEKVLHELVSETRLKDFEDRHELDCRYTIADLST
ncbi:MAG: type IV pili twitching motility protein PilT, partial [Solirubrobacteraceae bacterium]